MATPTYTGASESEDRAIRQIVALAMDAPFRANSGHSGTAMALAPLGVTLFSRVMRHDPLDPTWPDRDRFILSLGHASILQYALAAAFGYDVTREDLLDFRQPHSRTPGHPEAGVTPTVEVTTGPLGQGLANGVGMALAERILAGQYGRDLVDHRTWVVAGDGCLEEGISHEAASLAGRLGLGKLTVFYDDNHITIDGPAELALSDDTAARFRAYGWQVIELGERADDLDAIEAACREASGDESRPSLVIIRSHIAGVSPTMADRAEAHGAPFSAPVISEAKAILGVPDEPFVVDPELTQTLLSERRERPDARREWEARVAAASSRGRALLDQLQRGGINPDCDAAEPYEDGAVATRKALQRALAALSPTSPGLVAGSADLTSNTGTILTGEAPNSPDSPASRQIYYGVREFAMGAVMVGIARHGGLRPLGSTFFVFSDYERPAIRLAALSSAPVLFVFTHDSVGVGEDGPTHQPIEHLASLRAIPNLHVVRPSDANETLTLVHDLLTTTQMSPTALVLTRQDIPVLVGSEADASRRDAKRGGYVLREAANPDVTLVGTGSEVSVCLRAADLLAARSISARVVAMPCWDCFEEQPAHYREAVLRRDLPSLSLEAGSTLGWHRYVDEPVGIDTFGLSAPGSFAFEHFGITPDALVERTMELLERRR
jgi:transketolase